MKNKIAMTLIELLIVIALILVLVSLLMPVIVKVLGKSVDVSDTARAKRIAVACEAWRSEYGIYPGTVDLTPCELGAGAVQLLNGSATVGFGVWRGNPRGLNFYQIQSGDLDKYGNGADSAGEIYHLAFDLEGRNRLSNQNCIVWTSRGHSW